MFKLPNEGVAQLPTEPAEVVEAGQISTEVWSLLGPAGAAQSVLKVGVHLNLLAEPRRLDLDEGSSHSLHIGLGVVESHPEETVLEC